jgi:hypothetical protein
MQGSAYLECAILLLLHLSTGVFSSRRWQAIPACLLLIDEEFKLNEPFQEDSGSTCNRKRLVL